MKFKIVNRAPDNRDYVIEQTGHPSFFTMREVDENSTHHKKLRIELNAKKDYEAKKMENIEEHHAFVKELSEQDLFTAHMYFESKEAVKMCKIKLNELDKAESELAEDLLEMYKQIPELLIPTPAPEPVESPEEFQIKEDGK